MNAALGVLFLFGCVFCEWGRQNSTKVKWVRWGVMGLNDDCSDQPSYYIMYPLNECERLINQTLMWVIPEYNATTNNVTLNLYGDSECSVLVESTQWTVQTTCDYFHPAHRYMFVDSVPDEFPSDEAAIHLSYSDNQCDGEYSETGNALVFVAPSLCKEIDQVPGAYGSQLRCYARSDGGREIRGRAFSSPCVGVYLFNTIPESYLCQSFEGFYVKLYCPDIQCWGIANSDSEVCGGHGKCKIRDTCECDDNYEGVECLTDLLADQDPGGDTGPGSSGAAIEVSVLVAIIAFCFGIG